MAEFNKEDIEEVNKKLTAVLDQSPFNLGSEVYIEEGLIKSKVVLVGKPISKAAPDTAPSGEEAPDKDISDVKHKNGTPT